MKNSLPWLHILSRGLPVRKCHSLYSVIITSLLSVVGTLVSFLLALCSPVLYLSLVEGVLLHFYSATILPSASSDVFVRRN